MAGVTRLELATSCVTGRRSNQLSYTPITYGGHNRTWTYDPLLVRQVLSQLSYATIMVPRRGIEPLFPEWKSDVLTTERTGHLYKKNGGSSWTRTSDHSVMSRVLWPNWAMDPHIMAYLEGFEPPTHALEGRCSIQLSYRYISWWCVIQDLNLWQHD